jgi:HSP20 family molecular chaperone IbpA
MRILCGTSSDRLDSSKPMIREEGDNYILSFRLPPKKLDRLKVYLEQDRVIINAEFLADSVPPDDPAHLRVPYQQVFPLPSHVRRDSFFPLLDGETLNLTLRVHQRAANPKNSVEVECREPNHC